MKKFAANTSVCNVATADFATVSNITNTSSFATRFACRSASYGWKVAKHSANSAFAPGARVLCLLPAVDLEDEDDEAMMAYDDASGDAPLESFKGEIVRKMMSRRCVHCQEN